MAAETSRQDRQMSPLTWIFRPAKVRCLDRQNGPVWTGKIANLLLATNPELSLRKINTNHAFWFGKRRAQKQGPFRAE
jgi:hypothetical protein